MDVKEIVPFQTARKLKAAGFDEPCNSYYRIYKLFTNRFEPMIQYTVGYSHFNSTDKKGDYSAPTLWQTQKWLREKHNIHIQIEVVVGKRWTYTLVDMSPKTDMYGNIQDRIFERDSYPVKATYETVLSAGIDAALNLLTKT